MRVVDLHDHHAQDALQVAAQVEACGIEDIAEDTQIGDERDAPSFGPLSGVAEMVANRCREILRRRIEVVRVPEREQVRAISADDPYPPRDLVELIEIEAEIEDVVLERVGERLRAAVPDLALEEMGSHAAAATASAAIISAAAKPDRQPSSWNPYPRWAPA